MIQLHCENYSKEKEERRSSHGFKGTLLPSESERQKKFGLVPCCTIHILDKNHFSELTQRVLTGGTE